MTTINTTPRAAIPGLGRPRDLSGRERAEAAEARAEADERAEAAAARAAIFRARLIHRLREERGASSALVLAVLHVCDEWGGDYETMDEAIKGEAGWSRVVAGVLDHARGLGISEPRARALFGL